MNDSRQHRSARTRVLTSLTSAVLVASGAAFAAPAHAVAQCNPGAWGSGIGDGTSAATAYEISTLTQLQNIADSGCADEMVYFKLQNDIDVSSVSDWASIGNGPSNRFSGHFDGQGHTISGIRQYNDMGFFGELYQLSNEVDSATVLNLTLAGFNQSPNNFEITPVGGLAGSAYGATVRNVHVNMDVTGDWKTGGLIGYTDVSDDGGTQVATTIVNSSASGKVTAADYDNEDYIGGLIGYADYMTNVVATTASGAVDTTNSNGADDVGGLLGYSYYAHVVNSSSSGSVSTDHGDDVGGLIGYSYYSSIEGSSSSSTVSTDATGSNDVGGLVGYWYNDDETGTINNVSWTGTSVTGHDYVGGLVGYFDTDSYNGGIIRATVAGNVEGSADVGGLVGYSNYGVLHDAAVVGNVTAHDEYVGGIVGYTDYTHIIDATYDGAVVSTDNGYVGGIVGDAYYGEFSHVSASGSVSAVGPGGDSYVGGLVGYLYETNLTYGSASNSVTASAPGVDSMYDIGGAVGYTGYATISNVAATGSVTTDGGEVGGLVGYVYYEVHINNSYSRGAVSGAENGIGGLVGEFDYDAADNSVLSSYTTSQVTDTSVTQDRSIDPFGSDSDARFIDTSGTDFFLGGQYASSKTRATALTDAELQDAAGLKAAGWKIADNGAFVKGNTWATHSSINDGFPYLIGVDAAANPSACVPVSVPSVAFAGASARLSASAKNALNAAAASVKASNCSTVTLKGYVNASRASRLLSVRRAAAVQGYLQARLWDAKYFVDFNIVLKKSNSRIKRQVISPSAG